MSQHRQSEGYNYKTANIYIWINEVIKLQAK